MLLKAAWQAFLRLPNKARIAYLSIIIVRGLSSLLDVIGIFGVGILLASLSPVASSTPLKFLGITLDRSSDDFILKLLIFLLFLFAAKGMIALTLIGLTAKLFIKVETSISEQNTNIVLNGNLHFLHKMSRHETLFALTGSVQAAVSGILMPFSNIVTEITLLIYISISFVFINPYLAFAALAFFLIQAGIIQFITGKSQKKSVARMLKTQHDASDILDGAFNTFREITVSNRSSYFSNLFREKRYLQAKFAASMGIVAALPRYVLDFSLILGILLLLSFNPDFMSSPESLQILGMFLAGSLRIVAALVPMQGSVIAMRSATVESRAMTQLMSLRELQSTQTVEHHAPVEARAGNIGFVSLRNVSFSYPDSTDSVLDNISLQIKEGEFLAIVGQSGAGKSSMVDLMLGLQSPNRGIITIDGKNPKEFIRENTSTIAYVPQKPGLVHGSISDNVALGIDPKYIDYEWMDKVLELSHLTEVISSLPNGVHSVLGKHTEGLSGGQIQRLGIARALYQRPRLLVLDEATSALDAVSESVISQALNLFQGKMTMVVIAHRLSTVKEADRVIIMERGKIVDEGSFKGLLKTSPILSEFAKLMKID